MSFQAQNCKQTDQYFYWRVDNLLAWNSALAACEVVDKGSLLSIHDFKETSIVNELKDAKSVETYVWIGLHCSATCSSSYDFVWSDGTPLNYDKFSTHPCDFTQACVVVYKTHLRTIDDTGDITLWQNEPCNQTSISICKAPIKWWGLSV